MDLTVTGSPTSGVCGLVMTCLGRRLWPCQETVSSSTPPVSRARQTPGDATLLRFLRAREFHVERAREMLSASLVWRKKYQVDRILQEYESPSVVRDFFPGGWHHSDRGETMTTLGHT